MLQQNLNDGGEKGGNMNKFLDIIEKIDTPNETLVKIVSSMKLKPYDRGRTKDVDV